MPTKPWTTEASLGDPLGGRLRCRVHPFGRPFEVQGLGGEPEAPDPDEAVDDRSVGRVIDLEVPQEVVPAH
jgi:hypothetical protein